MANINDAAIDPLVDSTEARKAAGGKRRETLSRWITSGVFPRPDRIINGRNFWRRSTLENWLKEDTAP